jgi:cytidine deaminase
VTRVETQFIEMAVRIHSPPMHGLPVKRLLEAAREGARHAFLTKPGGTRYGAAVWTSTGAIHRCGQYSSFNHSTNIHAEMGALALSAAAGDPDVVALALVSTSAVDWPARPCGVCRQVIAEHARRIGRPIRVLMASWDGRVVEELSSNDLLPWAWEGGVRPRTVPWVEPDPPSDRRLRTGDHVVVAPGVVGRVLAFDPSSWQAWIEPRYECRAPGTTVGLPASSTDWDRCQREAARLGLGELTPWGDRLVLVDSRSVPCIPAAPMASVGLDRLGPLPSILGRSAWITGAHALGLADADSPIELVFEQPLDESVHDALCEAILRREELAPPEDCEVWAGLARRFGDPLELVRARRFSGSFVVCTGASWTRVTLTWALPDALPPRAMQGARLEGPVRGGGPVRGEVAAVHARGTPTIWELHAEPKNQSSRRVRIETWHADGMLVREGDPVVAAGIAEPGSPDRLVQLCSDRDFLRLERRSRAAEQAP